MTAVDEREMKDRYWDRVEEATRAAISRYERNAWLILENSKQLPPEQRKALENFLKGMRESYDGLTLAFEPLRDATPIRFKSAHFHLLR